MTSDPPPAAATSPSPTIDPQAQRAITAWHSFLDAISEAERHLYIANLHDRGVAFRGTRDASNVEVSSVDLQAKPWPTVVLADCLTGDKWILYNGKTGKPAPTPSEAVPSPHPMTITMIVSKERWGVSKIEFDRTRTCTA